MLIDTLQSTCPVFAKANRYRLTLFIEEWRVFLSAGCLRHRFGFLSSRGIPRCAGALADGVPGWRRGLVQPDLALDGDSLYWADRIGNKDLDRPVPAVVRGTYDYTYGGNGTWSFNTAYASSLGFDASVEPFGLLEEVERYEGVGLPIVASIAWKRSELSGTPKTRSEGPCW